MLFSETSASAFLLARFRGLVRVPEKQARAPNSARMPGLAHPCPSSYIRRTNIF